MGTLTNVFEYNGSRYEVYFYGISYRCPTLKIFGEGTYLSCKKSIARKLKIKVKELTEVKL
jgi:hypothetical protein